MKCMKSVMGGHYKNIYCLTNERCSLYIRLSLTEGGSFASSGLMINKRHYAGLRGGRLANLKGKERIDRDENGGSENHNPYPARATSS